MKSFATILVLIISLTYAYAEDESNKLLVDEMSKTLEEMKQTQESIKKIDFRGLVLKKDSGLLDCNKSLNGFKTTMALDMWAEANQLISKMTTCDSKKFSISRFSSEACAEAINCRKNIAQISGKDSQSLMNEIVAKDYAKNLIIQNSEAMDKLETLKRFAAEKYNVKSDKCNARFQLSKNSASCNLGLMDEVFINEQESCKFGRQCHNKKATNSLTFKDYKEKNKIPNLAYIVDYNEYRIENHVKTILDEDDELINDFAKLVTSEMFKTLKIDQQADVFLKRIETDKDPVLSFDFDPNTEKEKLKKSMKYKQLLKTFEGPNVTPDSFKTAFTSFRKMRAENILFENGACSETTDLKTICEEMTTLAKGEKLFKNSLSVEYLSSRNLSKEKDFDKFKSYMGNSFTKGDYDILINAQRCVSFRLGSEEFSPGMIFTRTVKYKLHGSSLEPDENIVDSSNRNLSTNFVGEPAATKTDELKMLDPKSAETASSAENSISSALANTQIETNSFGNQFNQAFTPGSYGLDNKEEKNEKEDKKEESVAVNNQSIIAPVDTKMADLMKRLASAEEEVDKMKAASEEADNNRIKQEKIDEENALIKDLKGQIAELKASKEKKEAVKESAVVNNAIVEQQKSQSNSYSSSFNSGITSAPTRQESTAKVVDSYDSGRSGSAAPSAGSANSRSISSVMLTATTNSDGNKVLPSGIVLTTVDGMSSEKATQTISKKIIELNGTPFYIEEGGMIKEIIAVVKDGKVLLDEKGNPIYEKIVKGKVGDKKFAKIVDKNRAPAAITDAADLKRDQEEKMKRDRAEYLKLKNLTNGIIKNK